MTKFAFSPTKIQNLRALHDWILVSDMQFEARVTSSGILLPNDNGKGTGIRPRWGQVFAVGPEQNDVEVGQWICVAHGRWTRGVDIEQDDQTVTIRRIDPRDILLVSQEQPSDDTLSDAIHVDARTR
jgi:co-chaperonin GroES (HSP10)